MGLRAPRTQFKATPQADGLFEHTTWYKDAAQRASSHTNHSKGRADTDGNSLLAQYAKLSRAAVFRPASACAETRPNMTDWRNEVLEREVARQQHVRLVRFHQASQAWGTALHLFTKDCSHVCYDPYYYLPLWGQIDETVQKLTSAHI